jgi:hypothetical protein
MINVIIGVAAIAGASLIKCENKPIFKSDF